MSLLDRLLGRTPPDPDADLRPLSDDLPRDDLFTEPLRAAVTPRVLEDEEDEEDGGPPRVEFRVEVRDAEGRRCPDLAVEAEITGPDRTAGGEAHTDLLGRVRFRMAGPPGTYEFRLIHVAAGALALDEAASDLTASCTLPD